MSMPYPAFTLLCASKQLLLEREYPCLIPALTGQGLALEEAEALAYNATLLYLALRASPPITSPKEVLERYSLRDMADLCELYGRFESGEEEWGENTGFEEGRA